MKTVTYIVLGLVLSLVKAQGNTYLKISFDDKNNEVNYPVDTPFVLEDIQGNVLLGPEQLKEKIEFEIDQPSILYVFTSWNPEPDKFELDSGVIAIHTSKHSSKKSKENNSIAKFAYGDPLAITKKRMFSSDQSSITNLSLVFENGITFYYKDGKAEAWLNGETLEILGKYVINSKLGILKISYDPYTTEVWYTFESKE